jgi:hypothetical protein
MPLKKEWKPNPIVKSLPVAPTPKAPEIHAEPTVVTSIQGWCEYLSWQKFHTKFRRKKRS